MERTTPKVETTNINSYIHNNNSATMSIEKYTCEVVKGCVWDSTQNKCCSLENFKNSKCKVSDFCSTENS